jgi:hypothetical protein
MTSACERFCTPSFRYTFARCVLTVSVEIPMTDAMAEVVRPVAAMRSTAVSRRVSGPCPPRTSGTPAYPYDVGTPLGAWMVQMEQCTNYGTLGYHECVFTTR